MRIHALALEHFLAIGDVAMSADGDVIVARVVNAGISFCIDGEFDGAIAGFQGVEVLGGIKMIVDVN